MPRSAARAIAASVSRCPSPVPCSAGSTATDRSSAPQVSRTLRSNRGRVYDVEDARAFLTESGLDVDVLAPQVEGRFLSAFVRASKPAASCCGPSCCA